MTDAALQRRREHYVVDYGEKNTNSVSLRCRKGDHDKRSADALLEHALNR